MGADDNIRSYSSYQHQPPLVLPRRGDAGYSVTVLPLRSLRYCLSYADYSVTVLPLMSLRYCLTFEVTPLLSYL